MGCAEDRTLTSPILEVASETQKSLIVLGCRVLDSSRSILAVNFDLGCATSCKRPAVGVLVNASALVSNHPGDVS